MKILIINPILYTSEIFPVKKVTSIKDTMIYNLCMSVKKMGHTPILVAAEDYRPAEESFDFEIIFLKTRFKKLFKTNVFPYMPDLKTVLKEKEYDFIISSEVFNFSSLYTSLFYKKKVIIWQELAIHNKLFKKIPSLIWYNLICRLFFRKTKIVPRSQNAKTFISQYCDNVSDIEIQHGIDLSRFDFVGDKKDYFIVVSQLIPRKKIAGIIEAFMAFEKNYQMPYQLVIIGTGVCEETLKEQAKGNPNIRFTGFLSHEEMIPLLSQAKAMLVNTEKDNMMISIVESIALGTPILTTNIPDNAFYIKKYNLGLVTESDISDKDLYLMVKDEDTFVENCRQYRQKLSNEYNMAKFIEIYTEMSVKDND